LCIIVIVEIKKVILTLSDIVVEMELVLGIGSGNNWFLELG